jgi:hypothetical protein
VPFACHYPRVPSRTQRSLAGRILARSAPASAGEYVDLQAGTPTLQARGSGPDLANGFANNSCGRPRMQLDQATICRPCKQACLIGADWSGQP